MAGTERPALLGPEPVAGLREPPGPNDARLRTLAGRTAGLHGLSATAFLGAASILMRADVPVWVDLSAGLLLWALGSGFLLNATLLAVACRRRLRRIPIVVAVLIATGGRS